MSFSDGTQTQLYGQANGDSNTITFAPGEQVTSLTMWGNGIGTRAGRIRLTTNQGQTFDHGKDTSGQQSFNYSVGSGILVGMVGRADAEMDALGCIFLSGAVQSVNISVQSYSPNLNGTSQGISQETLSQVIYQNPPDAAAPTNWTFSDSTTRTVSNTFTQSSATSYGASATVSVEATLFDVVKATASATFTWMQTNTTETSSTTSTEQSLSWGLSGTLQPNQQVTATATSQQGTANITYSSRVTLNMGSLGTYVYNEPGTLSNVVWTSAVATADVTPIPSSTSRSMKALSEHAVTEIEVV